MTELCNAGLVFLNPRSRWCSPPLIIMKSGVGNFRMAVDARAVSEQTDRVVWPMPFLQVILEGLRGSICYFTLDFYKGYWQFLIATENQEIYSILTDEGVNTPTRVLLGAFNSVAYTQLTGQLMFQELMYAGLLVWIDDLLGYAMC